MSIQVKEIAFLSHPVADIPSARRFYEQLLGLKVGLEGEFAPGVWWIEYDIAGVALVVTNVQPPAGSTGSYLALEVADLDAALAAVRAANIPLSRELQEFPPCRAFAIKDPAGNEIMLHQRKSGT